MAEVNYIKEKCFSCREQIDVVKATMRRRRCSLFPRLVSATPDACAIRTGCIVSAVRAGSGRAARRWVVTARLRWSSAGGAGLPWSPDPRAVSSHHVDLYPHQPDPPNQCGRGTDEARREALRNRLLQEQSRQLAERRVSDPHHGSSGGSLPPPRRPAPSLRAGGLTGKEMDSLFLQ